MTVFFDYLAVKIVALDQAQLIDFIESFEVEIAAGSDENVIYSTIKLSVLS